MPTCKNCGKQLDSEAVFCPKCGTPVNPAAQNTKADDPANLDKTIHRATPGYGVLFLDNLPEGYVIEERYEIKAKIGQGGFGAVYRAYDREMNVEKALKIIPEAIVHDRRAMESLRKEAQIMIKLNHPNIVRVYDFHRQGSIKFIDMEYVSGKSLNELLLDYPDQRMREEEVRDYAIQIAEALAYAHKEGVIHRDIKPQNIMVTEDGQVKIMDFGIAETVRTSMSRLANVSTPGTLPYMSPEQVEGKEIGCESDIYSLGATLYELLCGHPPFYQGDISYQILNKLPIPIDGISESMNTFLLKCLAKEPAKRYRGFEEVLQVLKRMKKEKLEDQQISEKLISEYSLRKEKHSMTDKRNILFNTPRNRWIYWSTGIFILLSILILVVIFLSSNEKKSIPEKSKLKEKLSESEMIPKNSYSIQIEYLLNRARKYISQNRLTSPAGKNAYEDLQKILRLSPEHKEARRLLYKIAGKYENWGDAQFQRGNFNKAIQYYRKSLEIEPARFGVGDKIAEAVQKLKEIENQRKEEKLQAIEASSTEKKISIEKKPLIREAPVDFSRKVIPEKIKNSAESIDIVPFAALTEKPEVIKRVKPVYPELAKKAGVEGRVVVKVLINTTGDVEQVEIFKGYPMLNGAAIVAAKQFKFKPGKLNDKPVKVWMIVPFNFQLEE